MRCFTVPTGHKTLRLDLFLARHLDEDGLSREKIKQLIAEGKVKVNGLARTRPSFLLHPGDELHLSLEKQLSALTPEQGDLIVLYRDQTLAVLNKPAGLTVHPAPGLDSGTLVHRLLAHFPELTEQEGFRPGIVHRLDKDTSGLMLVALTEECRLALAAMFARREVFKEYLALCQGVPKQKSLVIDAPIGRDTANKSRMAVTMGGKEARSEARLLHAGPLMRFALMAVRIVTGRTHQVRVHMRHIGHPLWGDKIYGRISKKYKPGPARKAPQRQMLHAWKLVFRHPLPHKAGLCGEKGDELHFICPPPADFAQAARCLSRRTLRVVLTGSPGCGKSTLMNIMRDKGFPVFSADACVADLYASGGDGRRLLRQYFGNRFAPDDENAPVDKKALGAAMAGDDALRRDIEALIHPLVHHAVAVFWQDCETADANLAFAEIPLYLESGARKADTAVPKTAPLLVGIDCPLAQRFVRLESKRHWSAETIARMESWQWPEDKKMRACDLLVDNSRDLEHLHVGADHLLALLENEAKRRLQDEVEVMEALWTN
ncbi:dephospho-CoA kinase [Desulfovibrio sp. OttesenSCG-928-M14]|nr:dephospho-CoA kinase [Desulfovibrio sp. OttesenSCG-928-M14]